MIEPTLNYVTCPGAALQGGNAHRMAYWEWNQTGNPQHPHVIVCVHGLTRQGRDFDVLSRALSQHARVICPDVVGRGHSDWLEDPMCYGVPQYTSDMLVLLAQLHRAAPVEILDWVGTSMGGLIGMAIAGSPQLPLPVPMRKLLLNDVGPELEWGALQRIASYVGKAANFASHEQAADALREISAGFGPHSVESWLALTLPMLRPSEKGGYQLHYDPAIAKPMQGMTLAQVQHSANLLWNVYDAIQAQTLLVRGAQSDLITGETAQSMQKRGPLAQSIELQGVGHAPTFVADEQVAIVLNFLLGIE
jgi:pimeloyl-ACP methyl ester carboxylesterase